MMKSSINFLRKRNRQVEVEPYSKLAVFYDDLMSHINYNHWASYLLSLAQSHKNGVRSVIDLACGTGHLAMEFHHLGLDAEGADGNPEMVEQAIENSIHGGIPLPFQVCDLRSTPETDIKDLVVCVYDSLNYLKDREDIVQFFLAAKKLLGDDSVFIFDCSTIKNSVSHFSKYRTTERYEAGTLIRKARYDKRSRIQHNEFELYLEGDEIIYTEHHQQKIWPLATIQMTLREAGFSLLGMYDGYTMKPGTERSDRVHFAVALA